MVHVNYEPFELHYLGMYYEAKGFILITQNRGLNDLHKEFHNGLLHLQNSFKCLMTY